MNESALSRVSRSLDLIPYLMLHPGSSIDELAKVFNTSTVLISQDLSLLHMCGLPGYSHLELIDINYEDPNFIEVSEPQVLDLPRKLSRQEGISLALGLDLLQAVATDPTACAKINSLKERISQSLGESELHVSIAAEDTLISQFSELIMEAITSQRSILIEYVAMSSDVVTEREVLPTQIEYLRGYGYLHAWDHAKAQMRTFRMDHILDAQLGSAHIGSPRETITQSQPTGEEEATGFETSALQTIVLEVQAMRFVEEHQGIIDSQERLGDELWVRIRPVNEEWLLRALLTLPGKVLIQENPRLQALFSEMISQALFGYDVGSQ